MQYVSVNILSNEECRLTYGTAITETMVCVEGNYNEGTCTVSRLLQKRSNN